MSKTMRNLLGAAAVALPVGATADSYGKYEAAPYVVEDRIGAVEIRQYQPHILAQVRVQGDRNQALNRGFRALAGYIFGGNEARASVDMTVPVGASRSLDMTVPVAQSGAGDIWTITFMMPSDWTLESLPVPNNEAITFREAPGDLEAVITFSGRATDRAIAGAEAELRRTLDRAGLSPLEPPRYYFYDDPFTLPWTRRNEVALILN